MCFLCNQGLLDSTRPLKSYITWLGFLINLSIRYGEHVLIRGTLHDIFPWFLVTYFAGNLYAQELKKAYTNQANIMGIYYFLVFGFANTCINTSGEKLFLSLILYSFYFLKIWSNFPFRLRLHHWQSMTPTWIGQSYNFVQLRLPPTSDKFILWQQPPPPLSTSMPNNHSSRDATIVHGICQLIPEIIFF